MTIPLRVLIIEDSEDDALLLLRELKKGGYAPVWERVDTAEGMTAALEAASWDIILSDYRMPRFDGWEALQILSQKGFDIPFIVISGILLEETAVDILKAGAGDYIKKGNWARLIPAVERELREAESRAEGRRGRKALEAAEARYRGLFENAVEGIFQISPNGRFISANPAMATILGFASPDALMAEITDVPRQMFAEPGRYADFVVEIQKNKYVSGFESRLTRRDGRIIWGALSARPVYTPRGDIAAFEGALQDVTSRKTAEKEKSRLEDQLRHSQKMEAIGTLAGGVAHDFNNLLQGISGFVQLLLMKKGPDDPDRKYLLNIEKTAERATELVRRLLTFCRKMDVKPRRIRLNAVIKEWLRLLSRTIPKMVAIETRFAPDLKEIHADPAQMEQVLMNLAINACDAMPHGGRLRIEAENVVIGENGNARYVDLEPGEYVMLTVSDSGHGMDPDTAPHIFEPFFTTKEIGKGAGLGLSIVYGIIKSHGGRISCYSIPGEGATFSIYLPALGELGLMQEAETAPVPLPERGGGETVLVVDDEEVILVLLERVLDEYGHRVIRATSGEEAAAVYAERAGEIDLILLDLGMPGMGGEKTLAELIRINPDVKVIVASGYAAHKIASAPEAFGAAGFITKPYRIDALMSDIRRVLHRAEP